jgi:hypothetical protein
MTTFELTERGGDRTGTDWKFSIVVDENRKVSPDKLVPNLPLAIGLVLLKDPKVAEEHGIPEGILRGVSQLGVYGAQALGTFILDGLSSTREAEIKRMEEGDTFDIDLSSISFSPSTRSCRDGCYARRITLTELLGD